MRCIITLLMCVDVYLCIASFVCVGFTTDVCVCVVVIEMCASTPAWFSQEGCGCVHVRCPIQENVVSQLNCSVSVPLMFA